MAPGNPNYECRCEGCQKHFWGDGPDYRDVTPPLGDLVPEYRFETHPLPGPEFRSTTPPLPPLEADYDLPPLEPISPFQW